MPSTSLLIARLYEHIGPIDRGARYEDPLDAALRAAKLGEVTGGGSQLSASGEIEFADVEILVADVADALPVIVQSLEESGAPVGSEIVGADGVIRQFGRLQSVAIYLDGVSLPDDVYANLDFDETLEKLGAAAGEGSYHGSWQGAEETGLFYFASDAEALFNRLEPALREMPIGQNARVVVRPSRDASQRRTVRLPRL